MYIGPDWPNAARRQMGMVLLPPAPTLLILIWTTWTTLKTPKTDSLCYWSQHHLFKAVHCMLLTRFKYLADQTLMWCSQQCFILLRAVLFIALFLIILIVCCVACISKMTRNFYYLVQPCTSWYKVERSGS